MGRSRKIHNTEPGYIAERMNPFQPGTKVTIYVASEQDIDVGENKYVVVCDKHGTICGTTSVPAARSLMKSVEFCEDCMAVNAHSSAHKIDNSD